MAKIFIFDSNLESIQSYQQCLGPEFEYYSFENLESLLKIAESEYSDFVVLADCFLAGHSIIDTIKKIPSDHFENLQDRLMIISDVADYNHIFQCLQMGCSDYILKPGSTSLIRAKIFHAFQKIELRRAEQLLQVIRRNVPNLTGKEDEVLEVLVRCQKTGASRDEIMNTCWKNLTVYNKTLDVHLFNLRRKLKKINMEIYYKESSWFLRESFLSNKPNLDL